MFLCIQIFQDFSQNFLTHFSASHSMVGKKGKAKTSPSDIGKEGSAVVNTTISTVPWSSLFFTYASRKDRLLLITGLICTHTCVD